MDRHTPFPLAAGAWQQRYAVAARDVRPLVALAADSGVCLGDILRDLGLGADLLTDEQATIGLGEYFRLLERLSLATQDETCHLSSRPLIPGSTHFAWSSIADARDLFDAMKRVAKAYNMLHGGHYNHIEMRGGAVAYVIDDRSFPYHTGQDQDYLFFTMECVLVFLHGTLMLVSGDGLQRHLRKVHSRRPAQAQRGRQLDFLGVPIRWNAPHYALVYDLPAAFLPIRASLGDLPPADAVYRKIVALIEAQEGGHAPPPLAEQVAQRLRQGMRNQALVAADLGMSVATLRRRLDGEAVSFRALRHAIMADTAKAMLGQGLHMAEVADALGFADFRSFTRAFKLWTGMTPARYRHNAPAGHPAANCWT